jgi:methyl coenzyme M reductase beta subunit
MQVTSSAVAGLAGGLGRCRPLVPGISIGHFNATAGTLSCFCRSTRAGDPPGTYLLGNNHVLADINRGAVGDALRQPGPLDGGTDDDSVAQLHRFVKISLGGGKANRVDAALGRLLPV